MTNVEAIAFLNGINPQPANIVTVDAVQWAAFKILVLALLASPGVDPKFKAALEAANIKIDEANTIVDGALK